MSKHTPGPWSVDDIPQDNGHILILDSGDPATHDEGPAIIAELWCASDGVQMADARLIAAAPDLLAALKDALALVGHFAEGGGPVPRARVDAIEAVIARAEGRDA